MQDARCFVRVLDAAILCCSSPTTVVALAGPAPVCERWSHAGEPQPGPAPGLQLEPHQCQTGVGITACGKVTCSAEITTLSSI